MKIIRPITVIDAVLASSNVLESDYPAYSPVTPYALGDRVIVVSTDVHRIYESLQAENTGHVPATEDTWWLEVGATNRWKMFDGSVTSQTSNADSIATVFLVTGRADSVALLNCSAASARITMTDLVDGVVYDKTYSMISGSGIADWFNYFFEPIERIADLAITDLPPYANSSISVTLSVKL